MGVFPHNRDARSGNSARWFIAVSSGGLASGVLLLPRRNRKHGSVGMLFLVNLFLPNPTHEGGGVVNFASSCCV
jgi:hypothetical protein